MKLKKCLITLAALVTVGAAGTAAAAPARAAQAKADTAVFPKKMHGTWYYYDTDMKKVNKTIFTKTTRTIFDEKGKKFVAPLHPLKDGELDPQFDQTYNTWIKIAGQPKAHGRRWINVQGFAAGAGDGIYYNVAKLKGHKVLSMAYGAGIWHTDHCYKTAKLAKQLKNRHYAHFEY
ncbi:hypothetical protein EQ500_08185 [Lactobacillus sp. XV13L]|nr:hypothetical protein [Lactobacillus sp. XV13L]